MTARIAELRARQQELIEQIALPETEQRVVMECLQLSGDVSTFLDKTEDALATLAERRKAVQFTRRLDKVSERLNRVEDNDARDAAAQAVADAVQRLLNAMSAP